MSVGIIAFYAKQIALLHTRVASAWDGIRQGRAIPMPEISTVDSFQGREVRACVIECMRGRVCMRVCMRERVCVCARACAPLMDVDNFHLKPFAVTLTLTPDSFPCL